MRSTTATLQTPKKPSDKKIVGKKEQVWTYEKYLKLDDGKRYEIIEGKLKMTPAPYVNHQRIARNLEFSMLDFVEEHRLGEVLDAPVDVVFDDETVLQPDILFVSNERKSIIKEKAIFGAPNIVIEIVFPSSSYDDTVRKKRIYAQNDVLEYWLVDLLDKSIEIFENIDGHFRSIDYACLKGTVSSKVLDGFSVEIEKILGG